MEEAYEKRLKTFWFRKGLLWVETIVTVSAAIGLAISIVPSMQTKLTQLQEIEINEAYKTALSELRQDLKDSNSDVVRIRAAVALSQSGDKTVLPQLRKALKDSNPYVRINAAVALSQSGDKTGLPQLRKALKDSNPYIRINATVALSQSGDKTVLPELRKALEDPFSSIRARAVEALGQLGDETVLPELRKALKDLDPFVRARAVEALGQLGNKTVLPELRKALKDSSSDVRVNAAVALNQSGDKTGLPELYKALKYPNSDVRIRAAVALKKLTPQGISQFEIYQQLMIEGVILVVVNATALILLVFSIRLRNPYPLSWSGNLLFPEETVAELTALRKRRLQQKLPLWKIRLELTYEVLLLFWAYYIQI